MVDYDFNLVFEGGGAKGLVFVGAIQEFERQGYTFGRLLGTSAGAITATLLAAGYDAQELLEAVNEKLPDGKSRFSTFMDVPKTFTAEEIENSLTNLILKAIDLPFISERVEQQIDMKLIRGMLRVPIYRQFFSFVEKGGLYAGQAFVDWFTDKLNQNGRNFGDLTLAEFDALTDKDLTVVASDTTASNMLVLNHRTAPDCPVVAAVRMSMSIPFVWQEIRWRPEWGLYRGEKIAGHTIVDGGVLSNFPIELLISSDPDIIDLMGPHDGVFAIGLLIDETLPVKGVTGLAVPEPKPPEPKFPLDLKSLTVTRRVVRLINTMLQGHDKPVIEAYADGVCRLPARGYSTTDFEMSAERVKDLVDAGQGEMNAFLKRLDIFLRKNLPGMLPARLR